MNGDMEDVARAYRKAKEEGDQEKAQRYAKILASNQAQGMVNEEEPQKGPRRNPKREGAPGVTLDMLEAMGETGAAMGTGLASMIGRGYGGLYELGRSAVTGEEGGLDRAAMIARNPESNFAGMVDYEPYQPRNPAAQDVLGMVGKGADYWQKNWAQPAGEGVYEMTGSPAAGAAAQTTMEFLPEAMAVRGSVPRRGRPLYDAPGEPGRLPLSEARRRVKEAESAAAAEGVDLTARGQPLRDDIGRAAEQRLARDRGGLEGMQTAQREAYLRERQRTSELYDEAKATPAGVTLDNLRPVRDRFMEDVKEYGWNIDRMPAVKDRLAEMDALFEPMGKAGLNPVLRLKKLDDFRKKINANYPARPAGGDIGPEGHALDSLRRNLDRRVEELFENDMISGDPKAVEMWKKARKEYGVFKDLFRPSKRDVSPATARVMRDIIDKDMSVHDVRNLIVGSNAAAPKGFATEILTRLQKTLPEEKWRAVQLDLQLDFFEPLLVDEVSRGSLRSFVNRVNSPLLKKDEYIKTIFPEGDLKRLKEIRDMARAALKTGDPKQYDGVIKPAIQWFVGHGIHRGSARMGLVERLVNAGRSRGNKREHLTEILGFDPWKTTIGTGPVVVAGVEEGGQQFGEDPPGSPTR